MNPEHLDALLGTRLLASPQLAGFRLFYLANYTGKNSLYAIDYGGSVPDPILPVNISLHNPMLMGGKPFYVFTSLSKILVMLDNDGDEDYRPYWVDAAGGFPKAVFTDGTGYHRFHLALVSSDERTVVFVADEQAGGLACLLIFDVQDGTLLKVYETDYELLPLAISKKAERRLLFCENIADDDSVLWEANLDTGQKVCISGVPLGCRGTNEVKTWQIQAACFNHDETRVITVSSQFNDRYGLVMQDAADNQNVKTVEITGTSHAESGELVRCSHLYEDRFLLEYNINGALWLYECRFHEDAVSMQAVRLLAGEGSPLASGSSHDVTYDPRSNKLAMSFSTATQPASILTLECTARRKITIHAREKLLGIKTDQLAHGEPAAYQSHDGTTIPATLYLPQDERWNKTPRPVVFYIHGGPQSQERPDFNWFSMPLIQLLTLSGIAVFVPNVRGSTGYGVSYTKQVNRDWGGKDLLDHVSAFNYLKQDARLDLSRSGVAGRSYGGYMTLMLAAKHPELFRGAVDMFGPYDLVTFSERIPASWKPYFIRNLANPESREGLEFLKERSPRTWIDQLACPLMVIQGANDPRVVAAESRDLVEHLKSCEKDVRFIEFPDEGHDVLKLANRRECYKEILRFFEVTLQP